ncbi:MAG: hypothetical protein NVS1B13_19270 [Flavisolibacter sp.]
MRTRPKERQLKESLKQHWLINSYQRHYTDQFGFKITYGETYSLYRNEVFIVKVYSFAAAKLISTIILNDHIMCKKIKKTA